MTNISYKNPIIKGFHPDPSICRKDEDYYLVTSSFEYLPAVPLFHSKNLIEWEPIGHCLTKEEQIDLKDVPCSGGIFAPTIRYHNGCFYMITTNMKKGNFIVKTNDIDKGFGNPIFIDIKGIDPSLYFENDKVYVQNAYFDKTGSYIQQTEIDIETGKILKGPIVISHGCGGRDVEAPHIYHINEWYYLLCAEGGTREGHMVTVQRSKNIYGPYEPCPMNPIFSNRDFSKEKLQSVGHGDLFQDSLGNWWMVALATRPVKHRCFLGRETILVPVKWKNGWPIVEDKFAKSEYTYQGMKNVEQKSNSFIDYFTDEKLNYRYNTIRTFLKEFYKLNNGLILKGNNSTLSHLNPSFIGIRQTELKCCFECKLQANLHNGDCTGLTVLIDKDHHHEIGLKKIDSEYVIYVKQNIADIIVEKEFDKCDKSLILGIDTDEMYYYFYYVNTNNEKKIIYKMLIKHLSVENSFSPFTGIYGGMFVEGSGSALFEYFKYEERL